MKPIYNFNNFKNYLNDNPLIDWLNIYGKQFNYKSNNVYIGSVLVIPWFIV